MDKNKLLSAVLTSVIDFLINGLIMLLVWNSLISKIFSLTEINYIQAMGLIVFCRTIQSKN